jgi:hypothetical protein
VVSREWKPGDVALVDGEVGLCVKPGTGAEGDYAKMAHWRLADGDEVWSSVRSTRRLVVIDPEDPEHVERLHGLLYAQVGMATLAAALCDFAAPPPPEPEPVVTDAEARAMRKALARLDRQEGRP